MTLRFWPQTAFSIQKDFQRPITRRIYQPDKTPVKTIFE
jgi:hypothetical protein